MIMVRKIIKMNTNNSILSNSLTIEDKIDNKIDDKMDDKIGNGVDDKIDNKINNKSKLAFIIGGTRGIGAAISKELISNGYKAVVNCSKESENSINFEQSTGISVVPFDVSNHNSCKEGINEVFQAFGAIDILMLNAGITRDAFMKDMTIDDWDEVIRTNLSACFYVTKEVVPSMIKKNFGRIVAISSVNGVKGQMGQTNYCASKAGIIGFVRSLAMEVVRYGITVNAVAPGYTDTSMVRAIKDLMLQKIIEQIPIKRLAHPEEIAKVVAFLCSDGSSYVTGETINVNGGMYMS